MAGTVKRSLSTPNVQAAAAAMADGGLAYSTDKRRNKLGYHRTSVACGHCRRRKIRCLLAKDDPHGRCSNCIRLKKDCNFYPVESSDRRPRSMSKPDISNHDTGSLASSPSPGLGMGPNGYPASVPVTPTTYDFASTNYDDFRHNSISSASGRLAAQSTALSRKPSLAQMHVMPLAMKAELLSAQEFPRPSWELASHGGPEQRRHLPEQIQTGLADPSSAFWRLSSSSASPMAAAPIVPSQPNMTSYDEADSHDEHGWHSHSPSRMGSVDQGLNHVYGYGTTYSSEGDFAGPPEMCSANASTASLTASISDASQYGGDSRPSSQFYSNQWADQAALGSGYGMATPVKQESYEGQHSAMFGDDGRYNQPMEDGTYLFQSSLPSPEIVSGMHV